MLGLKIAHAEVNTLLNHVRLTKHPGCLVSLSDSHPETATKRLAPIGGSFAEDAAGLR